MTMKVGKKRRRKLNTSRFDQINSYTSTALMSLLPSLCHTEEAMDGLAESGRFNEKITKYTSRRIILEPQMHFLERFFPSH